MSSLLNAIFDHNPLRFVTRCKYHPQSLNGSSSSSSGSVVRVRLPLTETRVDQDGKKYTVFLVHIQGCCASFNVLRRYSDFCDLHRDLTNELASISPVPSLPPLPGKKFLGSSLDAEFVATRRTQLEAYLVKVMAEPTAATSKALANFLAGVGSTALGKEGNAVRVPVTAGSASPLTASTLSSPSSSPASAAHDDRFSALSSQLHALEQKLRWIEDAAGSHNLAHEQRVLANELAALKRKVTVLELAQPYLQQMNKTTNGNQLRPSYTFTTPPPSQMNGNAKPFQSQHRSVSGPVATTLRYDNTDYHAFVGNEEEDEEEDGDLPMLPRSTAWSSSQGSAFLRPQRSASPPQSSDGEDRTRSLSESHATHPPMSKSIRSASSRLNYAEGSNSTTSPDPAIPETAIQPRTVLDNSKRSLSSIDPWMSQRFQLRNRPDPSGIASTRAASSTAAAATATGAHRQLTNRQHSDPLAANPNSATSFYREWVEELGIEVQQTSGRSSAQGERASNESNATSPRSKSVESTGGSSQHQIVRAEKANAFAGFDQAFPFIKDRKRPSTTSGTNTPPLHASKSNTPGSSSLFAMPLSIALPSSSASNAANPTDKLSPSVLPPSSAAISLPKPSVAHPPSRSTISPLGTSPDLPQSPELGASPALGETPDSTVLAAAAAGHARSTISPRALGISPVNLANIYPPPTLPKADSTPDEDDEPEERKTFTLDFTKQKVVTKKTQEKETTASSATMSAALESDSTSSSTASDQASSSANVTDPTVAATATSPSPDAPAVSDLLVLDIQHPDYLACLDPALHGRVTDLLTFLSPSTGSEARYQSVLHFIENLIRRVIGAEVFCHGSYALKTYLPDADLDVSAFFSKVHEESWVQKLVGALCQEAASPSAAAGPHFAVKSVTFVNALCQVVKCQIGSVFVDISGNQTGALATLALFEEVDALVGQDHLFKRTIILTKAWCEHEAGIIDSGQGFLSSYALRGMVLFIFNAFHRHIKTPLQGLYILLAYFGQFDWLSHAVGLFGPIQLSALPRFNVVLDHVCSWPADTVPLISHDLLSQYTLVATAPQHKHKQASDTLPRHFINVIDPCCARNNLGRSVWEQNAATIRQAFVDGSRNMRNLLAQWRSRTQARQQQLAENGHKTAATTNGIVSDETAAALSACDDADALDAYKLVTTLFNRSLQAYGSGVGGRGRFMPPRTGLKGRTAAGRTGPSGANSVSASGAASPALMSSSPKLNPVVMPDLDSGRDSVSPAPLSSASPTSVGGVAPSSSPSSPLDANLPLILEQLQQARQFETPSVSEMELVTMIRKLLLQYGSVPVGKLGSLLHNVMNNHSLPSLLKERYGGLKKFLERHTDAFIIGTDHPFNPSTQLSPTALALTQEEARQEQAKLQQLQQQQQQQQQLSHHHGSHLHHQGGTNYAAAPYQHHGGGGGGGRGHPSMHASHTHYLTQQGPGGGRAGGGQRYQPQHAAAHYAPQSFHPKQRYTQQQQQHQHQHNQQLQMQQPSHPPGLGHGQSQAQLASGGSVHGFPSHAYQAAPHAQQSPPQHPPTQHQPSYPPLSNALPAWHTQGGFGNDFPVLRR